MALFTTQIHEDLSLSLSLSFSVSLSLISFQVVTPLVLDGFIAIFIGFSPFGHGRPTITTDQPVLYNTVLIET